MIPAPDASGKDQGYVTARGWSYAGLGTSQRFGELLLGSPFRAALLSVWKVFAQQDCLMRLHCVIDVLDCDLELAASLAISLESSHCHPKGEFGLWGYGTIEGQRVKMLNIMRWPLVRHIKPNSCP